MAVPIKIANIVNGGSTNDGCTSQINSNNIIEQAICSCGGRVIRAGDSANNISLSGANWLIEPSAYFGTIYQTPIIAGPDVQKNVSVIIESQVSIPAGTTDGTLIIRIPQTYTDEGANIGDGYIFSSVTGAFEFLDGIYECNDIATAIAGDGFVIVATVTGGVLEQAPLAELCIPPSCELITDCITGVLADLLPSLAPLLSIVDNGGCAPHYLSWTGLLSSTSAIGSEYRIYRNGVQVATRPYNDTEYVDYTPATGTNTYVIHQYDAGSGQIIQSNAIIMAPTTCYSLLCDDFGDGFNGVLDSTTTIASNIMRFSSINLSGDVISITADGPKIWLVDGNVTMTSSTINSSTGTWTYNGYTSLSVHGMAPASIVATHGTNGNGGAGGPSVFVGPAGQLGGAGGIGATHDWSGINVGAWGGSTQTFWTFQQGQPGHNSSVDHSFGPTGGGGGGYYNATLFVNGFGGSGGLGGTRGAPQYPLIIIASGTISISSTTVINGVGGAGVATSGSQGAFGQAVSTPFFGRGGTGGGGGGGGGADGMDVYVYSLGGGTATPIMNVNGGLGGPGGISPGYPGIPATAGQPGNIGNTGASGTLNVFTLPC